MPPTPDSHPASFMPINSSALTLPAPPSDLARLSQTLENRIAQTVRERGAISLADYMRMALYEPGLGYYQNGLIKFGTEGDFVTAPEQGSLFATGLARQIDQLSAEWPEGWTLLELGAGRGVLARDLLMTMARPPDRYLILDTSPNLRQVQMTTLSALPDNLGRRIEWLTNPPADSFRGVILANEVMDALPVWGFEVGEEGVLERVVTLNEDRLTWSTRPVSGRLAAASDRLLKGLPWGLPVGYQSEISVDLPGWIKTVTEPLTQGLALFIDYGYAASEYYHPDRNRGTLVCHYRHRAHFDPFLWPGLTDLSSFVDFSLAAEAGHQAGLDVAGFTTQAGFLLSLGVHDLLEQANSEFDRLRLAGELKRLTLPGEMGEKFKVLALTRGLDTPLEGFQLIDQLDRL